CFGEACPYKMLNTPLLSKPCNRKFPGHRDQGKMDIVLSEQGYSFPSPSGKVGPLGERTEPGERLIAIPLNHFFCVLSNIFWARELSKLLHTFTGTKVVCQDFGNSLVAKKGSIQIESDEANRGVLHKQTFSSFLFPSVSFGEKESHHCSRRIDLTS